MKHMLNKTNTSKHPTDLRGLASVPGAHRPVGEGHGNGSVVEGERAGRFATAHRCSLAAALNKIISLILNKINSLVPMPRYDAAALVGTD